MQRVWAIFAILAAASTAMYAETWTGKLFDATCVAQHHDEQSYETCNPTDSTASFVIQVSGKIMTLDANGNRKAAEAFKELNNSADRSKDPNSESSQVSATVQGTLSGSEIKVESIRMR